MENPPASRQPLHRNGSDSGAPQAGRIAEFMTLSGKEGQPGISAREPRLDFRRQDFILELSDQIRIQVDRGTDVIRIRLRPEGLGALEISAARGAEGIVARIQTESQDVRLHLERNFSLLESSLANQGLKVERIEIFVQDNSMAHHFGSNSQHAAGGNGEGRSGGSHPHGDSPAEENGRTGSQADDALAPQPGPNATFHTVA